MRIPTGMVAAAARRRFDDQTVGQAQIEENDVWPNVGDKLKALGARVGDNEPVCGGGEDVAHLVREHREGRHRVYRLNPEPLRAVDSWLEQYRTFWKMNLTNLKTFVEAEYAKESRHQPAPKSSSPNPKGDL